jgi:ABC-type multidrug transport system fused ATPase/permease subunit
VHVKLEPRKNAQKFLTLNLFYSISYTVYKNTILFQVVWFSSPLLVTICSFFCYTKIQKGEFTPAVAFTAMVLFTRLKAPLNGLPAVYMALTNASVSLNRIAEYLEEPNIKNVFENRRKSNNAPEIGMKDMSAQWWTTDSAKATNEDNAAQVRTEDVDQFILRNINVSFPVGELSIICGPTGSGKTSLLMAMLGEMDVLFGNIYLPRRPLDGSKDFDPATGLINDGVAFVSQQAWLQNASIRDNILFGSRYEEDRYNEVIEVCALKRDLEILEDGDQTEIGEKGITLSGGQKQRVSLARAIYSRSRHVLLDDCLSAVDAHTAEHIYGKCLIGPIMKNRTCVLVTHHVRLCIPTAKLVVLMHNGEISLQGTVQQLREQGTLSQVLEEDDEEPTTDSDADTVGDNDVGTSSTIAKPPKLRRKSTAKELNVANAPVEPAKDAKKLVLEETRQEGRVKWSIYQVYVNAVGGIPFWLLLLAVFALTRTVEVSESLWVREWANSYAPDTALTQFMFTKMYALAGFSTSTPASAPIFAETRVFQTQPVYFNNPIESVDNATFTAMDGDADNLMNKPKKDDTDYYLAIYALISISASLAHILQTIVLYFGSLRAARLLYKKLLMAVVRAPLRFFDTTPVGRIMNRFSNDFETVDSSIANNFSQLLSLIISVSSIIIVLAYITPAFVFVAAIISVAYLAVGKKYISTSRELKRLHSVSRSPIYSMFGETLAGLSTIRAFSEQSRFMSDLLVKIDDSNRPFYFLWIANRWLSVRSDSIGAVVALSSGVFILMNPAGIDAGTAGLALTYALEFVALVNYLVREYTQIEMELNAIERITEYTVMAQEPPAIVETRRPPASWPTEGAIEVKDLELKYAPDLETVLRGISFKVESRQKIGVVGR